MNWVNKSKIGKDESYAGAVATAAESVALEHLGKGDLGTAVQTYKVTDGAVTKVTATVDLSTEIKDMIGASKCKKPTQSKGDYFLITITPSADGKTVDVAVSAVLTTP